MAAFGHVKAAIALSMKSKRHGRRDIFPFLFFTVPFEMWAPGGIELRSFSSRGVLLRWMRCAH